MVYLYGIVRARHPAPAQPGLGQPPGEVRIVTSGPIGAAVSDVAEDLPISEDDARSHLRVLVELLRDGPVLPLRLGTVASSEDEARREVLDAGVGDLLPRLEALDGVVELQLDVDDDEAESLAAIAATPAGQHAEPMDLDATIELGQQIAGLLMAHRQELADEVVGRLSQLSVDNVARALIRGPEDPVLRWAFLVRLDDLPKFDEAIAVLRAERPNLAFRYVGPLPAAHFVDRTEVAAHQAADTFRGDGSWGW
ncbi:MAG: hypothetical protein QOE97_3126 [Pseudonocardiales bacterium]|nr:hypothetical protein [Pseudonocardiales bacterium]